MYLADLREWPLEVALKALERWPERSEWWPTWHELLGVLGEVTAEQRPPALPRPQAPEHRPFSQDDMRLHAPFRSRAQWDEFCELMRQLRDPSVPMIAREPLLAMGERIERRQRPHAERMGWA